jgi:hypothetical protein
VCRHRNRNAIERVFHEVERGTYVFSNMKLPTAESWLQAFAVWWNRW